MIFDYNLMFVDDKNNTQKNVTSGVMGETLDLSGNGQGKGFRAVLAIAFSSDTTATADPDIQFAIETAETKDFTNSVTIPLSLPLPLKKSYLTAGTVLPSEGRAEEICTAEDGLRQPDNVHGHQSRVCVRRA